MLIMTPNRRKVCNWGPGENIRLEDWTRDEREGCWTVYLPSQSTALFRGTEEQCKAVLDLIFTAHGAGENFVVPTPEELTQDDDTIKRIVAEAILTSERRQQRKAERDMANEIMADAWLRDNDPMGGEK